MISAGRWRGDAVMPPPPRRDYTRWLLVAPATLYRLTVETPAALPKTCHICPLRFSSLPNFRPAFVVSSLARCGQPMSRGYLEPQWAGQLQPGRRGSSCCLCLNLNRVPSHFAAASLVVSTGRVPRRLAALTGGPPVSADTLMTAGYRHHPSTSPPPS